MRLGVASIGGITMDSVQGANGDCTDGLLGGNAAYGAWGASLWLRAGDSHVVGLVGGDFPQQWLLALADSGIAVDAVEVVEALATSVWRASYTDGEHRTDLGGSSEHGADELEPHLREGTEFLDGVGAVHLAPVQPSVLLHNLFCLRDRSLTVLVDPGEESAHWTEETTAEVLAQTDVYCPSLDDLAEPRRKDPLGAAARLHALGPETVVVKLGSVGSLVRSGRRSVRIPAAPAAVVDPTGAGDSYCGAFAAALVRFDDPFVAGVLASATASVAVEHGGLLACLGADRESIRRRAQTIAERVGVSLPVLADP